MVAFNQLLSIKILECTFILEDLSPSRSVFFYQLEAHDLQVELPSTTPFDNPFNHLWVFGKFQFRWGSLKQKLSRLIF